MVTGRWSRLPAVVKILVILICVGVRNLFPELQWLRLLIVTQPTERVSEVLLFTVLQPGWYRLVRSGQEYSSESPKTI